MEQKLDHRSLTRQQFIIFSHSPVDQKLPKAGGMIPHDQGLRLLLDFFSATLGKWLLTSQSQDGCCTSRYCLCTLGRKKMKDEKDMHVGAFLEVTL